MNDTNIQRIDKNTYRVLLSSENYCIVRFFCADVKKHELNDYALILYVNKKVDLLYGPPIKLSMIDGKAIWESCHDKIGQEFRYLIDRLVKLQAFN